MLREFLTARTAARHRPAAPATRTRRLRASLVAAQLIGIAMLRHVAPARPVARASPDEIVALVAPVIEQYLR